MKTHQVPNTDGTEGTHEETYFHATGKRPLNMPVHCPTCDKLIRMIDGKPVSARLSSPYDGGFDPNIHARHQCPSDATPGMSDADFASTKEASGEGEANPFNSHE